MPMRTFFLILFTLVFKLSFSQDVSQLLEEYIDTYHTEKIYIHHDKPNYTIGETIWCKVYLVDGITHQFFEAQPIVYVDWINPNGEILKTFFLKIKKGVAELDIKILDTAPAGIYTLRAYTLYQKNFEEAFLFQKEIPITDFFKNEKPIRPKATDYSIQFFPEGGDLVEGLKSKVTFKAIDNSGKSIVFEGQILDKAKKIIAPIKTLYEGMGYFSFTPEKGQTYTAEVEYEGRKKSFPLPKALTEGYVMKVDTRPKAHVKINLSANTSQLLEGCEIIGHIRGQVFFNQPLENKSTLSISIIKETLPTGLLHFTLFDSQKRPVGERLVFNKNQRNEIEVTIDLVEQVIKERAVLDLSIATSQPANYSFSVYNKDLISESLEGLTIENYLLLQSDLKGRINNINQYFLKDNIRTRTLLDLLLMTHGWRRFNWQQILDKKQIAITYPTEESFSIAGKIKKENKNKAVKANVYLSVLEEENFIFSSATTNENGLFLFDGFMFTDTLDLLIQAEKYSSKNAKKLKEGTIKRIGNKYVDVELINLQELTFNKDISIPLATKQENALDDYIKRMASIKGVEIIDSSLWTIELDAVTVSKKRLPYRQQRYLKVQDKYKEKGIFYFPSTTKYFAEDLFQYTSHFIDVFDLIKTAIPGARVSGPQGNRQVFIGTDNARVGVSQGDRQSLIGTDNTGAVDFALNGIIVSSSYLNNIPAVGVDVIEVMSGIKAEAVYGKPLVVVILTKEGIEYEKAIADAQNIGMQQIQHPGFYQAKTFYSPSYELGLTVNKDADNRSTLYWHPSISTTKTAEKFRFYTGDIPGNYLIWVEGITESGIPFTANTSFVVEKRND